MATSTSARTCVAILASAAAAAALVLVPGASAQAAVHGEYAAFAQANADYTGSSGGSCDLTAGLDHVTSPVHDFNHGSRSASVDLDATFTNSLDSSDSVRVRGHADSTLTLHRKHGDLTDFDLGVGGSVSVQHSAAGSSCQGTGSALGGIQVVFTEHKKGYFYVTRDTKKPDSVTEYVLINVATDKLLALDVYSGDQSHETGRTLLKPGQYELVETQAGLSIGGSGIVLKSAPLVAKAKLTVHLQGEFKPSKRH